MNPKWDWTVDRIAWLDAETDGLVRPGAPMPLLLEVAVVVTDAAMRELGRYEAVIRHPEEVLRALSPHQVVVDMHEKSGLWEDLFGSDTVPIEEAEREMVALLDLHCGDPGQGDGEVDTRPVVWGGFSPAAVDRPVVGYYMPSYYSRIHHRSMDVSALKLAMKNWAGVDLPKEEVLHRAMLDTEESIRLAECYRRFLLAATGMVAARVSA